MNWFYNLKIKSKLLLSFTVILSMTLIIGFTGYSIMMDFKDDGNSLYLDRLVPISDLGFANAALLTARGDMRNLIESLTSDQKEKYKAIVNEQSNKVDELMDKYSNRSLTKAETETLLKFQTAWNEYKKLRENVFSLALQDNMADAKILLDGEVRKLLTESRKSLVELININAGIADEIFKNFNEQASSEKIKFFILISFSIVSALIISLFISTFLSKGIKEVAERMESLSNICLTNLGKGSEAFAEGDLKVKITIGTKPLEIKSEDELGKLAVTLNQMIVKTQGTVASVEIAMKKVIETTEEINSIVDSTLQGKLQDRGRADKFNGGFKEIINGLNNTLEAFNAPIKEQSEILEKMGKGDLTARMIGDYKGDFLVIKNNINQLGESLSKVIGEVTEAVQATASASNEISSSSEEMAAGAQEQSSQTTEVAGAVEQMTKTIFETTKNSGNAAEAAKNSGAIAIEGGKVVAETIEGMNRVAEVVKQSAETVQALGKSSDQIGEIVQVIDDIADQTNLLALNAAIEAARAGEQGRGFAVVADEVRKLAERTTKATKEIAAMIRQIQKDTTGAVESMSRGTEEVEKGKALADKAGQSLKQIISGAQDVVDMSTQVAAASEEQSSAAEQISKNVEAISSVTQESAAGIQQIARAAEDLNRLTLNLQELISRFKIDESSNSNGKSSFNSGQKSQLAVRSNGKLIHH